MEFKVLSDKFSLKLAKPLMKDFLLLRSKAGWGALDVNLANKSLNHSLFHVTIYHEKQLVAMGRVVGDGAMYFYIQDVIVDSGYQKLGLGAVLMDEIERYLGETSKKGSTIGLLASQGKEAFYAQYGYMERPNSTLGHGMCKFI